MSRQLTASSTLESLKKEANRWLKALRADDEQARVRLSRAWPEAPAQPGLRAVQRALAMEHGLAGWSALKEALAANELAGCHGFGTPTPCAWEWAYARSLLGRVGSLTGGTGLIPAYHRGVDHSQSSGRSTRPRRTGLRGRSSIPWEAVRGTSLEDRTGGIDWLGKGIAVRFPGPSGRAGPSGLRHGVGVPNPWHPAAGRDRRGDAKFLPPATLLGGPGLPRGRGIDIFCAGVQTDTMGGWAEAPSGRSL
jgi:hypothetical protein